jgi:asparagine synthase (glutamine-hydrolysing)
LIGKRNPNNTWKISVSQGTRLDDAAVAGARLDSDADLDALVMASFSRATSSLARLWPATDLLRCGLSGGRDSRLLAANLLADGISPQFYTNRTTPRKA